MSDPKEYTIGWISALSIEHTAARLFLDREHDPPEPDLIAATDNNAYTLGEISGHRIVIAVLPQGEYGTSTAASVATNMFHSFPNIRVALLVGIGGGAPTAENDIRLGDVVVSIPRDGRGGVFQYDYGKRIQDRGFQATGHLNQPPPVVLTAISKLKSNYEIDGHGIDEAIKAILEEKPRLKKHYSRPPPDTDVLYASHVVHPEDGKSCKEVCMGQPSEFVNRRKRTASDVDSPDRREKKRYSSPSRESDLDPPTVMPREDDEGQRVDEDREEARLSLSRTIDRSERGIEDDDPAIHYGSIASGNSLMKDALMRDELATKEKILCFEMEASGIMNNLPCLVVRGICDYSDSHKNKQWQGYAALTAAAYTKDLLKVMLPKHVEKEGKLLNVLENLFSKVTSIQSILETSEEQQQSDRIKKWLSPSDPSTNLETNLRQRHQGTCHWLLDSDDYHNWRKTPGSFFWLHGLSGCGKTVLASSVIEQLRLQTPQPLFAYFYFDVNGGGRRDLSQMLRTVIYQLCSVNGVKEVLLALYCDCSKGTKEPTITQLSATLTSILDQVGEATIIIDALDECSTPEDAVLWLKGLSRLTHNLHLLVTSRNHGLMNSAIGNWPQQVQVHAIQIDKVNRDIACYVHERLFEGGEFVKWGSHQGLREKVEDTVLKQANGM
ncbi:purine and uridine phosphorylase, partial [Aureobasidium melanogenum]